MCYASLPAVMMRELRGEDVRMVRMRDEDEDDLIEWVLAGFASRREDLATCQSWQSNSRAGLNRNVHSNGWVGGSRSEGATNEATTGNVGVVVKDAMSLHRLVNYLVNFSIHCAE